VAARYQNSYNMKWWFALIQGIAFFCSLYYYFDHINHCTPAAYSKYALLEWILSACNILFDATAYFDLENSYLAVGFREEKTN